MNKKDKPDSPGYYWLVTPSGNNEICKVYTFVDPVTYTEESEILFVDIKPIIWNLH